MSCCFSIFLFDNIIIQAKDLWKCLFSIISVSLKSQLLTNISQTF